MKFKLVIAYDGTGYEGWQVQKTGTGVQEKVETALAKLFPSQQRLHSASRTDTGVHALGMVAHFEIPGAEIKMSVRQLALALNAWLPADIRVLSASARGKISCALRRGGQAIPLFRLEPSGHEPAAPPDRVARDASAGLASHARRRAAVRRPARFQVLPPAGITKWNPPCARLTRCDIQKSGPQLTFIIEGDGFLYKMCRGIVGTLVQIGLGKFPADEITRMLAKKDRRVAGMTAPAPVWCSGRCITGWRGSRRRRIRIKNRMTK